MITSDRFQQVEPDSLGNPRYILDYPYLLDERTLQQIEMKLSDITGTKQETLANIANTTAFAVRSAMKVARKLGGKPYNSTNYQDHFVFTEYDLDELCYKLNLLLTNSSH